MNLTATAFLLVIRVGDSMSDWWTTGNQILVAVIARLTFVFSDHLHPKDIASLSQTSTRRHTDCKVILKVLRQEYLLRVAEVAGKSDGN